jgi:hypothetical protein
MVTLSQMLFSLVVIAGTGSDGCKKEKEKDMDNALLTGFDQRQCPCCGGPMLTFSKDPTPYKDSFYLVENDLAVFGISESTTFPVAVKVAWKKVAKCSNKYVHIDKLTRR